VHDNFGQLLRDGTSQLAQGLTPGPAHLVRARGSRRSRRKAAGTTALAVALIVAGGGGAYALSQQPHAAPAVVAPVTPTPTAPATPRPSMTPTQLATPTGAATTPSGTAATAPLQPTSASSATTAPAIVITVCETPAVECNVPIVITVCVTPAVECNVPEMKTEPTVMDNSVDGVLYVEGLTWSDWGGPTATGTGTMEVNNCEPNCASGTRTGYPATVTLSRLKPYLTGTEGYTTIVFSAPTSPVKPTMTFANVSLPTSTNPYATPTTTVR
jgi:hypothetical protein